MSIQEKVDATRRRLQQIVILAAEAQQRLNAGDLEAADLDVTKIVDAAAVAQDDLRRALGLQTIG